MHLIIMDVRDKTRWEFTPGALNTWFLIGWNAAGQTIVDRELTAAEVLRDALDAIKDPTTYHLRVEE